MTSDQQKLGDERAEPPLVPVTEMPSLSVPETGVPVLSPSQGPNLEECHWDFAEFQEAYVRSYISLADTKAAWTFTITSGMLAYLFSRDAIQVALLEPQWSLRFGTLFLSVVFLVLSAFHSFRVVAPRLKSPSAEGIVFFSAVAALPNATSYVSAVASKDKETLAEARLKHCYDVSRVCDSKYSALKKSIWLGLPGVALALVSLLWSEPPSKKIAPLSQSTHQGQQARPNPPVPTTEAQSKDRLPSQP